jgi:Rap1a immunity proteins
MAFGAEERMTKWLMVVATLLAVTPAEGASEFDDSANFYLPYCVSQGQIPPHNDYAQMSFCWGLVYGMAIELRCVPLEVTLGQEVRAVIKYITARPERMHEPFVVLADEAIRTTWCEPLSY